MSLTETARLLTNAVRLNPRRAADVCIGRVNDALRPNRILDIYEGPGEPTGRVLLAYMTEPFHDGFQLPSFQGTERQSSWQARELVRAFNELGYAVDVFRLDADVAPTDYAQYDVLFGLEPNFERYARRVPSSATRIYFATGMHWSQRNPAIREHVARLEARRDVAYEALRLLPETDAETLADALVVIGDDRTAATYTDHVGDVPVHQLFTSTYDFLDCEVEGRDWAAARSNLLWLSGGDLASKGLDETLEVVTEMPEVDLYVCGPLETDVDFVDVYREELFETENVHPVGWVDLGSERFRRLTERCGFVIHTGHSEGFPGSVAHCMARGLVPIVTPEVIADTGDWGVSIPDHSLDSIRETIEMATRLSPEEIEALARRTCARVDEHHSRDAFATRIRDILRSSLET